MEIESQILKELIESHIRFKFCTEKISEADKQGDGEAVMKILPHFMRQFYQVERLTNRLSMKLSDISVVMDLVGNIDEMKEYVYLIKERMEETYGAVQKV